MEQSGVKLTKGEQRTMTLNLSVREMDAVERLAAEAELSKTALIRQALRLYEVVNARIRAGETMTFSGDRERVALFVGPGWDAETRTYDKEAQRAAGLAALSPENDDGR